MGKNRRKQNVLILGGFARLFVREIISLFALGLCIRLSKMIRELKFTELLTVAIRQKSASPLAMIGHTLDVNLIAKLIANVNSKINRYNACD